MNPAIRGEQIFVPEYLKLFTFNNKNLFYEKNSVIRFATGRNYR